MFMSLANRFFIFVFILFSCFVFSFWIPIFITAVMLLIFALPELILIGFVLDFMWGDGDVFWHKCIFTTIVLLCFFLSKLVTRFIIRN